MSRRWQRILTAKAVALSALLVAVATAGTERQLDADSSWHPRHEGYPPSRQAWLVTAPGVSAP